MSKKSCLRGSSNVVNGPKRCWNINESTFTIFIDPCKDNSGGKSLSEWYAKSWDCLWTHWLPIISILILTGAIYCKIFKCNYLKKKFLDDFFFAFSTFTFSFQPFQKKKVTVIADVILNLRIQNTLLKSERQHLYQIYWSLRAQSS